MGARGACKDRGSGTISDSFASGSGIFGRLRSVYMPGHSWDGKDRGFGRPKGRKQCDRVIQAWITVYYYAVHLRCVRLENPDCKP